MPNVKFAPMVITLMTIWLFSARLVTSVCIKDALGWQKFQLKVGSVTFALLLDLQESIYPAPCVTLKVEPWREPTSISTQIYGKKPTQVTMSTRRDARTTNKSNNTYLLQRFQMKIRTKRKRKNFTTIISTKQPTHQISPAVIMFGYIMSAQSGCLSATLRKRMVSLMLGESKTLIKNATNMNALYARSPKVAPVSNVKTLNAESITIQNAPEKREFIWNNSTYKKSSIWSFAKNTNLSKSQGKLNTRKRKIEMKSSSLPVWLKSTLKLTRLQCSLSNLWKSSPQSHLFKLLKTIKKKRRSKRGLKLSTRQMKISSRRLLSSSQRSKRFLSL